jgi:hypothetical protein
VRRYISWFKVICTLRNYLYTLEYLYTSELSQKKIKKKFFFIKNADKGYMNVLCRTTIVQISTFNDLPMVFGLNKIQPIMIYD